jgi:hypothetical protein
MSAQMSKITTQKEPQLEAGPDYYLNLWEAEGDGKAQFAVKHIAVIAPISLKVIRSVYSCGSAKKRSSKQLVLIAHSAHVMLLSWWA